MTEYVLKVDGKEFPLPAQSRDYCNTIHEVGETDDSVFESYGLDMKFEMDDIEPIESTMTICEPEE